MTSTGITVDLETSMICASNEWWKARESVIIFLIVLTKVK